MFVLRQQSKMVRFNFSSCSIYFKNICIIIYNPTPSPKRFVFLSHHKSSPLLELLSNFSQVDLGPLFLKLSLMTDCPGFIETHCKDLIYSELVVDVINFLTKLTLDRDLTLNEINASKQVLVDKHSTLLSNFNPDLTGPQLAEVNHILTEVVTKNGHIFVDTDHSRETSSSTSSFSISSNSSVAITRSSNSSGSSLDTTITEH